MLGFSRIVDEVPAPMAAAVGAVVVAATLESGLGICLGCLLFAALMRIGLVPASVGAECADLTLRRPPTRA